MAEKFALSAEKREIYKQSARDTRNNKKVPAVVYGHGFDPVTISVGASDILKTYRKTGTSSIIDLDIEGQAVKVLVHKLDLHPVRDEIWHVDFFALNLKEVTTVSIPLRFVGESPAVKTFGAIFLRDHDSISLRCLPTDIPHDIEIDISVLKQDHDHISIKDLNLDTSKFELMGLAEEATLCSVVAKGLSTEDEDPNPVEAAEGEAEKTEE